MGRFYENGVFFACQGCGNCCSVTSGWVEMDEAEIAAAASLLKVSGEKFKATYGRRELDGVVHLQEHENGACIFLDSKNKCQIYPARPKHCRDFPFRPENMKNLNRWQQTKNICSGIGKGRYHSYEEIRQILATQRKANS
jgi:Fe-S-cluster containining protein